MTLVGIVSHYDALQDIWRLYEALCDSHFEIGSRDVLSPITLNTHDFPECNVK